MSSTPDDRIAALCDPFLALETKETCRKFFADIWTPNEVRALANRWQAILLLHEGLDQRTVARRLSIAIATVEKAAQVLKKPNGACVPLITRHRLHSLDYPMQNDK